MLDGTAQSLEEPALRLSQTIFDTLTYDLAALVGPRGPLTIGMRETSTPRLLRDGPPAGVSTAQLMVELNGRLAQPLIATAAALIGFAALVLGAFSRLGIWRQVLGAVAAVIAMYMLHTAVTGMVLRRPDLWALVYLPPATGLIGAATALWMAGRARRMRSPGADLPEGAAA
jgi:lipopolysaccharide export system permease protein